MNSVRVSLKDVIIGCNAVVPQLKIGVISTYNKK